VQHKAASVNAQGQPRPRGHCILASPNNRFVLAPTLAWTSLFVYRFDAAKGTLTPNDPPFAKIASGTGPRHIAFHPNKKLVYVVSEMGNIVTMFQYADSTGTLTDLGTVSTLPKDFTGKSTSAEIEVDRAGKFPVHLQPRPRQHRPVRHRPEEGDAHSGRVRAHAGQDAPQLRPGPHRTVSVRGESGFEQHRSVSRGS